MDVPVFVLTLALGLGVALSVRSDQGVSGLAAARQDDLVSILADLGSRNVALRQGIAQLQAEERQLSAGTSADALRAAQQRVTELGILAGTVAVHGPGIVATVADPKDTVSADTLVDALEELRDAGVEAMDLSGVRVVASTSIVAAPAGGMIVDGTRVQQPYRLSAIGDPQTLQSALAIPGGVDDSVATSGGGARVTVLRVPDVQIASLASQPDRRYARPDASPTKDGP
ncbi:MAG: DUF881 domain-containing protein [Mycobacteriales bacterium]